MTYTITVDYATLPAALMPIAKQHLRVDFDDDDEVIEEYLAQAIGLLEQFWGLAVFSASVVWSPDTASGASRYQVPVQPVSSFSVADAGAVDVTADYALETAALIEPAYLVRKDGTAFHAGAVATLTVGFAGLATIPPPMRAAILTVAGTRYEHRESTATISIEQMPHWLSDVLGGLWVPRA